MFSFTLFYTLISTTPSFNSSLRFLLMIRTLSTLMLSLSHLTQSLFHRKNLSNDYEWLFLSTFNINHNSFQYECTWLICIYWQKRNSQEIEKTHKGILNDNGSKIKYSEPSTIINEKEPLDGCMHTTSKGGFVVWFKRRGWKWWSL